MNNNTEENSINENDLPVLEPPPGFEDECMFSVNDHYYDDPYSEGEEDDSECKLILDVANKFAESMVESIFSLVFQPRVKLRSKKSPTRETPPQSIFGNDEYSVPIDSLINRKHKESRTMTVGHARHSIAVPNSDSSEPIHMTLEEVRCYLQEFEGNTSRTRPWMFVPSKSVDVSDSKRKTCFFWTPEEKKRNRKSLSVTAAGIKQALFSVFRIPSHHHLPHGHADSSSNQVCPTGWTFSLPDKSSGESTSPHQRRALPPLPQEPVGFVRVPRSTPIQHLDLARDIVDNHDTFEASINSLSEGNLDVSSSSNNMDFAASIEEVKDHGWYWGPLSGEAAEKILSNEPDGSFLVRDSSDDHYIFSLSFKLNGGVRHVRIEHDHGNFSFGSVARFRSQTMVEFIDKAIEHSRSGRFLFFLHRRPTHGPTRVQLLHPVSRFRQVQSLQHICRFVILKFVRRDQISLLPLPKRLREYLNTAHYYSEQLQVTMHSP